MRRSRYYRQDPEIIPDSEDEMASVEDGVESSRGGSSKGCARRAVETLEDGDVTSPVGLLFSTRATLV